jgi:hypothetical protein
LKGNEKRKSEGQGKSMGRGGVERVETEATAQRRGAGWVCLRWSCVGGKGGQQ